MRNLLKESKTVSTTCSYINSDMPYYDVVHLKVQLNDKQYRLYQIFRNSFVDAKIKTGGYEEKHFIEGITYDGDADRWYNDSNKRTMWYSDNESFAKAIIALQKKIK